MTDKVNAGSSGGGGGRGMAADCWRGMSVVRGRWEDEAREVEDRGDEPKLGAGRGATCRLGDVLIGARL